MRLDVGAAPRDAFNLPRRAELLLSPPPENPSTARWERSPWVTERFYAELQKRLEQAEEAEAQVQVEALRRRLQAAVLVRREEILARRVQFGAEVTVFAIEEAEEQTFQIVSDDEADLALGRLSVDSPLADALLGAEEGDEVEVGLRGGEFCIYEVTAIRLPRPEPSI